MFIVSKIGEEDMTQRFAKKRNYAYAKSAAAHVKATLRRFGYAKPPSHSTGLSRVLYCWLRCLLRWLARRRCWVRVRCWLRVRWCRMRSEIGEKHETLSAACGDLGDL